jgi:hypothetical protein
VRIAALAIAALLQMFTPPLRIIDAGAMSRIEEARLMTIHDQATWSALWRTHAPDKALPAVDWSKEMVAAVFVGARMTAGYRVEIVGYREEGGRVVAGYREIVPARDAISAQVLTSPYAIAALPRRDGDVVFEKVD